MAPCGSVGWLVGVVTLDYKTRLVVYVPPPDFGFLCSGFFTYKFIMVIFLKNFNCVRGGSADDQELAI